MKRAFVACILTLAVLLSACGSPAAPLLTATPLPPPTATLSPEALQEAVFTAAREDDVDAMKRYIAVGADVNASDDLGVTALNITAYRGNAEMIKLLLDAGATFEIATFHIAISKSNDDTGIVQAFIDHGVDINEPASGIPEHTALMYAAEHGYVEIGRLLLANGADINAVDSFNDPALNVAAFNGQLEFTKMLVEMGAELNFRGFGERTAVGHALFSGHEDVAKFLIEAGATE